MSALMIAENKDLADSMHAGSLEAARLLVATPHARGDADDLPGAGNAFSFSSGAGGVAIHNRKLSASRSASIRRSGSSSGLSGADPPPVTPGKAFGVTPGTHIASPSYVRDSDAKRTSSAF